MFAVLAFAVLAPEQLPHINAATMFQQAGQMPKNIYYLANRPSGAVFCDDGLRRQQARQFDKRYGLRLNRLARTIADREGLGWEADDIVLSSCYRVTKERAAIMLDDFEHSLREYERDYGL